MKNLISLVALLLTVAPAFAEDPEVKTGSGDVTMGITVIVFIITSLILLVVSLMLLYTFKIISSEFLNPSALPVKEPQKRMEWNEWEALRRARPGIWSKILGLRPLSEEKDILIEHEYDGITELDNPTPAWFNWLFYGTIVFGIAYLLNYHVFHYGKLQDQEYAAEMKHAQVEKAAYLAKSANNVDENNVKESKEATVITAGEAVFKSNCVACHGDHAQGVVGPNLTDEYWLHGGRINSVFKTIKYGVPEKGMISWEKTLTPKQISDVANYILSLKGSNPPNPKAPQGDKEG